MRSTTWILLGSIAVTACDGPGGQSAPAQSASDSAGVSVIEQTIDTARVIQLEEELRLGSLGDDENQQFFRVRDAELGPDHDLWILDSGNELVKVFGLDGAFGFAFGRGGSGPGEFERSATSLAVGPSVVVTDINGRVHSFGLDGSHVATASLRSGDPALLLGSPVWAGERVLIPVWRQSDPVTREWLGPRPLYVYEVDFDAGRGEPTGFEWMMRFRTELVGSIGWIIEPLFSQTPTYALDGLGRVHLIETAEYRLDLYGPDGSLERRVTNRGERVPVTDADIDAYADSRQQACPPNAGPESEGCLFVREALPAILDMPTPEFRAVVSRLYASAAGDLLVLRADIDPNPWETGDDEVYDLFDSEGRYRGRFVRPASFNVMQLTADRLIAVERDELDVEQVVVYRIVEPSGA
jgi:hypothetical protein